MWVQSFWSPAISITFKMSLPTRRVENGRDGAVASCQFWPLTAATEDCLKEVDRLRSPSFPCVLMQTCHNALAILQLRSFTDIRKQEESLLLLPFRPSKTTTVRCLLMRTSRDALAIYIRMLGLGSRRTDNFAICSRIYFLDVVAINTTRRMESFHQLDPSHRAKLDYRR